MHLIGGTAAFGLVLAIKENNSLDFIKKIQRVLIEDQLSKKSSVGSS